VLERALADGVNSVALRNERLLEDGHSSGNPIWTGERALLSWVRIDDETHYSIRIIEKGGPRFAAREFAVLVTVAPLLEKGPDKPKSSHKWPED
jgi:hypothetical protein